MEATAARIAATAASGCETIDTCDASSSLTVDPARSAMRRSTATGMTRSSVPMTAQLGIVFHAGAPDGVTFATSDAGRWLATIVQRSASGRSCANDACTTSGFRKTSAAPSGAPG